MHQSSQFFGLTALRFPCDHGRIGSDLLDLLPNTEGHLHGTRSLHRGFQEDGQKDGALSRQTENALTAEQNCSQLRGRDRFLAIFSYWQTSRMPSPTS